MLSTGVAVNDGHWHHVVLVWKGKTFKDKDGQERKGELVVYVNNVVLYSGAGQNNGAKEISTSAGTFSLGSGGAGGGGSSCESVLASVAVLSRCLDVKGVASLFATPLLRGTEKGLELYYDFDFEVSDEKPAQEVLNRARKAKVGSCGLLKGSARLVFLM